MAQPMFEPSDNWKQTHGLPADAPDGYECLSRSRDPPYAFPRDPRDWSHDRFSPMRDMREGRGGVWESGGGDGDGARDPARQRFVFSFHCSLGVRHRDSGGSADSDNMSDVLYSTWKESHSTLCT